MLNYAAMATKLELSPSVAIIICGVVIAGAIVFVNRFPGPATAAPQGDNYAQANVPAPTPSDHVYGSPEASVFLIEYSDFQCIYCARAYPTLKSLVDESGGTVALIHRHFPLENIHPEARNAAVASECVAAQLGNEGFWRFADIMFENGGSNQGAMSLQFFASAAGSLGINPVAYNTCVAARAADQLIDQHIGEAFTSGGSGTPYTVVYGNKSQVPVSGALPKAQFEAVIKALQARQ